MPLTNRNNLITVSSSVSLSLSTSDSVQKNFYECLGFLKDTAFEDGVSCDSGGLKLFFPLKEDKNKPFLFLQISFLNALGIIRVKNQGSELYYRLTQLGVEIAKHLIFEESAKERREAK